MGVTKWLIGYVWKRREILAEPSPGQISYGAWQEISRGIQIESAEFPDADFLTAVIRNADANIEPDHIVEVMSITELPAGWGLKLRVEEKK